MDYLTYIRNKVGNDKIILCNCAVVIYDKHDNVLLQLRADTGDWGIPGGFFEFSESAQACILREVKEEMSMELDANKLEFFGIYANYELEYPSGDIAQPLSLVFKYLLEDETYGIYDQEVIEARLHPLDALPTIFFNQIEDVLQDFKTDRNKIWFDK